MEMKSFASDKVGPGGETAASKKAPRKPTGTLKTKDPRYDGNQDDSLSIQIYQVVGNLDERLAAAGLNGQGENPNNKGCQASNYVIGDEVLLSLAKAKDQLNRTSEQKFLDIACMIKAENANKKKCMQFVGKKPAPKCTYATVTASKTIIRENPRPSVESTSVGVGVNKQLYVPAAEDYGYMNYHGNEETVTDSCPFPKKADVNDKETEKKSANGVSSTGGVPEEGAAGKKIDGMAEASGSVTGMKNGSYAPVGNAEKITENKGQEGKQNVSDKASHDIPDKVPEKGPSEVTFEVRSEVPKIIPGDRIIPSQDIKLANDFEEVVISSGFAWGNHNHRNKYCDTTGNTGDNEHRVENLIPDLKINQAGSVEVPKKVKRESVAENGNAVETREGRLVEKTGEEDKKAIQDEEIGSVAGEPVIEEGNKRKRVRKNEEPKKLNPKKRKVEKGKKNDSNDTGDGKDKGKGAKKDSAKPGSSGYDHSTLEETIDRVASGHLSLPFIENLRGEIKSLSRADLEELIVQKLCEVVTERSAIGYLRKRAEALEKNQERWKEKVLSLTKQIREMDMVMKNYLSEVRRHQPEKNIPMIAPLRVTRSVGLQVSFTSTPSKLAKTMPKTSKGTNQGREKGGKNSNRGVNVSQSPNKKIPILPTTSSTKPLVLDPKNHFSTKSGLTITLQPASSSSEAQLASKPIPIQQPKLSILPVTDPPRSGMIDLTSEEERRMEDRTPSTAPHTLTVGPPGQVKVVNHIQSAQSSVGAVTLLISNAASSACCGSSSTATGEGQNRQLGIPGSSSQSTQRHILPAIPTLIYNPNALIQPGSQVLASQVRSSAAKLLKHPAPLPPPPANQMQNPNWKLLPPRPSLRLTKGDTGIVLSWNMPLGPEYETIVSYQLFAYQETDSPPSSSMWKRVGDIKALRLPMACTLTKFLAGQKYYFAVRAVDMHSRVGPFSTPSNLAVIE